MASLNESLQEQRCLLRAHHVFGRDPEHCHTVIADPRVSRIHASISWQAGSWELRDYSRNGTWVSQTLIEKGEHVVLLRGDLIHFGGVDSPVWRVEDLDSPADMLWPMCDAARPIVLDFCQVLPGDMHCSVTVMRSSEGEWLCDDTKPARVLHDGDEVRYGALRWKLVLATRNDGTAALPRAPQSFAQAQRVDLTVSSNEEHVVAELHTRGAVIQLGERAHHYCLVTLARARNADARAGYDIASQGWIDVDVLAHMLGTDVSHVNVQIHRARMQFAPLLSPGSPELVERRRGSVRFGALEFRIVRADRLECQSIPADPADTRRYWDQVDAASAPSR
jgi:hypothetical protein